MTAELVRKKVEGEVVHLDYATLSDTDFSNCKLVYKGGTPPVLDRCTFFKCMFIFENEALNTMRFLGGIAGSDGGRELVIHDFLQVPRNA